MWQRRPVFPLRSLQQDTVLCTDWHVCPQILVHISALPLTELGDLCKILRNYSACPWELLGLNEIMGVKVSSTLPEAQCTKMHIA